MKTDSDGLPHLDKDLTTCIVQLAKRAEELNEPNTAIVLFTLAGQRSILADAALALVAREQAIILQASISAALNKPKDTSL